MIPALALVSAMLSPPTPPAATQNALRSDPFSLHEITFVRDVRRAIDRFGAVEQVASSVFRVASRAVRTDFEFNELIPSWNLTVAPGAAYRIELRIGREAADEWSAWYCFDEAGTVPPARPSAASSPSALQSAGPDAVVRDEWGDVRTDYLVCIRPADRFEVRLTWGSCGTGFQPVIQPASVSIDRFTVCYSNTLNNKALWARHRGKLKRVDPARFTRRIDVPFLSQHVEDERLKGNICSPTSVAMVLGFRGVRVTPREAAQAAFDPRHNLYGNWPRNVQAAYAFGVPGYVRRFASWDEVEAVIAAGQPIIASIRDPDGRLKGSPYPNTLGHLLVICGFDAAGDVLVNDPAGRTAERGRLTYDRAQFEVAWLHHGGVAYILEAP